MGDLYSRKPVMCFPLTSRHHANQRKRFSEQRDWTQRDWRQVLLTDDSRFNLEWEFRRVLVWRKRGTQNNPLFVLDDRLGGLMVGTGIIKGEYIGLNIIRNGNLMVQRYANEILRPMSCLTLHYS
ncbi:transposable element Tcb2 transposase [Trichonephila clavipes]|nr:transposable element Tcb2 transposase [Trichonephila clavipes]